MKLKKFCRLSNESGVTLIELLAAITILSIIVVTFLSFFIQGARTNTRASDINEATFIAQEEMELLVHYSQTLSIDDVADVDGFEGDSSQLKKSFTDNDYTIVTSLMLNDQLSPPTSFYTVTVEVKKNESLQAILENRLAFE